MLGSARIEGSIDRSGWSLFTTAEGGVNWRNACFGNLPLLASSRERSPPPPPPFGATLSGLNGVSGSIEGMTMLTAAFTACCPGLVENTLNTSTTIAIWKPVDIMKDFFWRPYRPQISFTATGLEVTSSGG